MANEKEQKSETAQKNVVPMPGAIPGKPEPKIEVRGFPASCLPGLGNYQTNVNAAVNQRNAFIEGVAMSMGLDNTWAFDMNGFLNNRSCQFVRQVKEEAKAEKK